MPSRVTRRQPVRFSDLSDVKAQTLNQPPLYDKWLPAGKVPGTLSGRAAPTRGTLNELRCPLRRRVSRRVTLVALKNRMGVWHVVSDATGRREARRFGCEQVDPAWRACRRCPSGQCAYCRIAFVFGLHENSRLETWNVTRDDGPNGAVGRRDSHKPKRSLWVGLGDQDGRI
jgi:hypothetical protein